VEFKAETDNASYNLEAFVKQIGQDFLVGIWGGRPHIGAIALAQPRPSLKDQSVQSATASVFCLVGHKDDIVAKEAAEKISSELNTNVTVMVGIHFDDIDEAGIKVVIENSRQLVTMIIEEITTKESK
jgi:hypothetical protein